MDRVPTNMNFLERLVADWYAHQGYLVQSNFKFGKRAGGGYEGEMDVLAVKLGDGELIHIETSSDAESWKQRVATITRKFNTAQKHYASALGINFTKLRQVAIVGARPPRKPITVQGIEILSIHELMAKIKAYVREYDPATHAIPESYGYLRAVQFAVWFGD